MTDNITISRAVVEQALVALTAHPDWRRTMRLKMDTIDFLRAALEQPVAGIPASVPAGWKLVPVEPTVEMAKGGSYRYCEKFVRDYRAMLAAAPQLQVEEQPQGDQEPVAWIENVGGGVCYTVYHAATMRLPDGVRFDLYTRPHPRQPLTDQVIQELADEGVFHTNVFEIVRRIEEEHGIFKLRAQGIGGEA